MSTLFRCSFSFNFATIIPQWIYQLNVVLRSLEVIGVSFLPMLYSSFEASTNCCINSAFAAGMSDDMPEVPGEPLFCFLDFSLSSPRVLLGAALPFPLLELKKANELDVAALSDALISSVDGTVEARGFFPICLSGGVSSFK